MATVNFYGPYVWFQPPDQNALMPGEQHAWFVGAFTDRSRVFQASAHAEEDGGTSFQRLAVNSLFIDYSRGGPVMNFVVRNVGTTPVSFYSCYVTGTGD